MLLQFACNFVTYGMSAWKMASTIRQQYTCETDSVENIDKLELCLVNLFTPLVVSACVVHKGAI
ncbi:hypothetical protein T4D_8434 [Trichinella pseudospiralis]|uniref:Uncharacterized protein n=1 Tax=Trichinella pseudospiralis TaxID=6337 RepID=A0A0V1FUR8_TRIPS|nr:hypothetical protein T4D_8434 [Trichinella pseudospiralis]